MEKIKYIDRTYKASMINMFAYSMACLLIPLSLESIKGELLLTYTQTASITFISSLVQLVVLLTSVYLSTKINKIYIIRTSIIFMALGMFSFSKAPNYYYAIASHIITGIGIGLSAAMLTPLVVDLYEHDKGSKQILLHSFYPLGVFTMSPLIGLMLSKGLSWRNIFVIFSCFMILVLFLYPSSKKLNIKKSSVKFGDIKKILSSVKFWLLGLSITLGAASEVSFTYWLPTYIYNIFGTNQFKASIGASIFALGMFTGRFTFSRIAKKISVSKIVMTCFSIMLLFAIAFILNKNLTLLYILTFFIGSLVAPSWPSIQTYAVQVLKKDPTVTMILLTSLGMPGNNMSVLFVGMFADKHGLKYTFYFAPIFVSILLICMTILYFINKKEIK